MISLTKEEEIRRMLEGFSNQAISAFVGVARSTVACIRKTCMEVEGLTFREKEEILDLLRNNFPIGAIETRSGKTESIIKMIRRYYYLQSRVVNKPMECPTCNRIMEPFGEAPPIPSHKWMDRELLIKEVEGLYSGAAELVELRKLNLVHHPLFYDLALRTEEILKRIGGSNCADQ